MDIYDRTQTPSIQVFLAQKHLRWVGHVIRMPAQRLPRQILYGQLQEGCRSAWGQRKRYKDHIKSLLKRCNIQPTAMEDLAADRNTWRTVGHKGITHLQDQTTERRKQQRVQRHQRAAGDLPSSVDFICPTCGKPCGSRIGLHSHMQWHRRNPPQ